LEPEKEAGRFYKQRGILLVLLREVAACRSDKGLLLREGGQRDRLAWKKKLLDGREGRGVLFKRKSSNPKSTRRDSWVSFFKKEYQSSSSWNSRKRPPKRGPSLMGAVSWRETANSQNEERGGKGETATKKTRPQSGEHLLESYKDRDRRTLRLEKREGETSRDREK